MPDCVAILHVQYPEIAVNGARLLQEDMLTVTLRLIYFAGTIAVIVLLHMQTVVKFQNYTV